MDLGKVIAYNLKELRTQRNLTLGQLAKISGISKGMLSEIEKGEIDFLFLEAALLIYEKPYVTCSRKEIEEIPYLDDVIDLNDDYIITSVNVG